MPKTDLPERLGFECLICVRIGLSVKFWGLNWTFGLKHKREATSEATQGSMGGYKEEYVVVRRGLKPWDPTEITINCPDKLGLGFDLTRIVFEFGLYVTKGDISTDGRWCFVVLWVTPLACPSTVHWQLLKERLEDVCPTALAPCWLPRVAPPVPESERVLLLGVYSSGRTGLHDVVQKLWKMELTIHKAQVNSSPEGKAIGLFFVTDNRNKLSWTKERVAEVKTKMEEFFGDIYSFCEITSAGPKHGGLDCYPLPTSVAKEIFWDYPATFEQDDSLSENGYKRNRNLSNRVVVTIDNSTSPAHSLLQISCKSRKGLLYDCLRIVKDLNLKVAHGRIPSAQLEKDNSELCLFVVDSYGRQITDAQEQMVLVQCMEREIGNPIRIEVGSRGIDTQLVVATPIEKGGRGRPRVLHDVTQALNILDIIVLKAEVGRYVYNEKRWEMYQFLLVNKNDEPFLTCSQVRNRIMDRVWQELLG